MKDIDEKALLLIAKLADQSAYLIEFTDDRAVHHDSKEQYFWCEVLGGCGCGTGDEMWDHAWLIFIAIAAKNNDLLLKKHNNNFTEVILHWIDSKDLIEHGGTVWGSWLTEKGLELLSDIARMVMIQ